MTLIETISFQILLPVLLGAYLGLWIHEGTHFLFGRIFGGSPQILYMYRVVPKAVKYRQQDRMEDYQIRIAGGSTIIWLMSGFTIILSVFYPESVAETFVIGVAIGMSIFSPTDLLALSFPKEWRELTTDEDGIDRGEVISRFRQGVSRMR